MDDRFVSGVFRTTSWVFAVALLAVLGTRDFRVILGFVLGVGIGVGLLWVLRWSVRTAFRPDASTGERVLVGLVTLLKYAVVGFAFWLALSRHLLSPWGVLGGFLLPQSVIFLQAVALLVLGRKEGKPSADGNS